MKNQFTISSAYQWSNDIKKINHSEIAIKTLVNFIKNRFTNTKDNKHDYNINYRRLRASAGKTMLDSIIKRIENSQVIIIDLTEINSNVFIETGISLYYSRNKDFPSVYFILEKNSSNDQKIKHLLERIPSDLQGYFISEYIIENENKAVFKDNGSLRMSIESDVKEYFNAREISFDVIDEINDK